MARLHRHPRLVRVGGLGAIAGGVALFVVASVITPQATAHPEHARRAVPATPAVPVTPDLARPVALAPSVAAAPVEPPTHAKRAAPVDHGVISSLAANGIPSVALNAYRVAAARMGNVASSCGIDWALLAGIGREESDHGRFAGAVLRSDGVSTPPIVGPALDGVRWAFVPAPANGLALDGDAEFAHALGPMQFIPSTWSIYGADATGDARADIFNINDAALGAARYLCAAGGDLRTREGQVRAVLAYNHSDEYLAQVLALADAYRRGVPITGLPVGITTGDLPKVTDTGYLPPANPGAPTAAGSRARDGHRSRSHHPQDGASSSPSRRSSPSPSTGRPSRGGDSSPSEGGLPSPSATSPSPTTSRSSSGSPTSPSPTASPSPTRTCNVLQIFCKH